MIHLDTHIAVWVAAEQLERLPTTLRRRMDAEPLAVSPMVRVELSLLHEIGRVTVDAETVLARLASVIGLAVDPTPFDRVAHEAALLSFTRDPFDRLIAGQARAAGASLATRDRLMREHLPEAIWDDE